MRQRFPSLTLLVAAAAATGATGCFWVTTKSEGKALRHDIDGLDNRVAAKETEIGGKVTELQSTLDEAAKVLKRNSADLGADVERIDDEFGFDIPQLYIVNISLPEAVEKALDTRTSMGVIGDMNRFQQYQMGQAMTAAAENPSGGGAAEGMGLGMGFAMAGKMMQGANAGAPTPGSMPPPPPGGVWHIAANGAVQGQCTMAQIPAMVAQGAITPETMVWSAGMGTWMAAGQVPQLAGFFNAAPPPPPPK